MRRYRPSVPVVFALVGLAAVLYIVASAALAAPISGAAFGIAVLVLLIAAAASAATRTR